MEQVNTKMAQLKKELELLREIKARFEELKLAQEKKAQLKKELELAQEIRSENTQKFLKIRLFNTRSKRSFWNRGLSQDLKLMFSSEKTLIALYSKKSSMISKETKT